MKIKPIGLRYDNIILFLILTIGAFLRFDRLGALMTFFGDQAWFYLSARDMILTGKIPLVGITSSHTWLHQGPLWTYMLAGALSISSFNPVSGAILTAFLGVLAIIIVYKIGKEFVSLEFGLIYALLYATSPLVVLHSRMAYHTSPISLVVLGLIYVTLKWISGQVKYFPLVGFCLALLYNLELATVVFVPVIILVLVYGIYKKERWAVNLYNPKIIALSVTLLVIPMIPILIYDFNNGYPQTVKYAAWFFYKILQIVGMGKIESSSFTFKDVILYFFQKYTLLIFLPSSIASIVVFFLSLFVISKDAIKDKTNFTKIILLMTLIPLFGFFTEKTTSEAYLPMIFPGLILSFSYFLYSIYKKYPVLVISIVLIVAVLNSYYLYSNAYLMDKKDGYGTTIQDRIKVVKNIQAENKSSTFSFALGQGQFQTNIAPYEYLAWWVGRPAVNNSSNKYVIYEYPTNIRIIKLP